MMSTKRVEQREKDAFDFYSVPPMSPFGIPPSRNRKHFWRVTTEGKSEISINHLFALTTSKAIFPQSRIGFL